MLARTGNEIAAGQFRSVKHSLRIALWIIAGIIAAALMIAATVLYGMTGSEFVGLG